MRAVVCTEIGPVDRLSIADVPNPVPGPGQVVIDVDAAGFNFPDLLIIEGRYQFDAQPPFSPGQEGAGVVAAVGNAVTSVSVGQRVAASAPFGAFAEQWLVDEAAVLPLPEEVASSAAAASTMTYGTSYHALVQRAHLAPGETLLVLGAAGGVGSAAVELGKAIGATVIAAASTDAKLAFCRELGADHVINYVEDDLRSRLDEVTNGSGPDVIYDPVGGAMTEAAFRSIGWRGRHLIVGFTAGDIPKLPLNLPLLKGASVVGVFWGSFAMRDRAANLANANEIFRMIGSGQISPRIMETVALGDFRRGFDLIASRTVMGKVLLAPA